jgi:hypothetical protein
VGRRCAGAAGVRRAHRPPSLEQVRRSLHAYGFDPADLQPLPGQDRRSARYLVSSHSRPDLFVKVVSRERRDSDLLYRCWRWLAHRGRPASGCWTGTSPRCWRRWRVSDTALARAAAAQALGQEVLRRAAPALKKGARLD